MVEERTPGREELENFKRAMAQTGIVSRLFQESKEGFTPQARDEAVANLRVAGYKYLSGIIPAIAPIGQIPDGDLLDGARVYSQEQQNIANKLFEDSAGEMVRSVKSNGLLVLLGNKDYAQPILANLNEGEREIILTSEQIRRLNGLKSKIKNDEELDKDEQQIYTQLEARGYQEAINIAVQAENNLSSAEKQALAALSMKFYKAGSINPEKLKEYAIAGLDAQIKSMEDDYETKRGEITPEELIGKSIVNMSKSGNYKVQQTARDMLYQAAQFRTREY